jgi:hypothetical protein
MKRKRVTIALSIAALGAAVIAGRILLLELFPGALQVLASALT